MDRRPDLTVVMVAMNWPGYQSLALGYLSSYALADPRLAGRVGFATLDLSSDMDPWWVAYRVIRKEPDVAAFSVMCWNARAVCLACSIIKQARPDIYLVVGGPEVGPVAEQWLAERPHIDAVVRGEGEETFADLLHTRLKKGKPWRVEGVTTWRDGEVYSAPERPLITDLDSIPSPYLTGQLVARNGAAYIETFRGCPYNCAYCYEGKGYGRIRRFSHERVAADIEMVATTPGVQEFSFIDSVFNLNEEHLADITRLLEPYARQGKRLHTIEVDIERVGPEQAAMLRRAGVITVETGPQTVGSMALDTCNRKFDRERFRAGVEACKAEGIVVECDLIVGLPGDTFEDFLEGLEFVLDVDPGIIQFSTLHVLPGTDLWDMADELGLVFNRSAPHEIIRTASMDYLDLRRAEVLGSAVTAHYRACVDAPSSQA